jgi:hypothetical protein
MQRKYPQYDYRAYACRCGAWHVGRDVRKAREEKVMQEQETAVGLKEILAEAVGALRESLEILEHGFCPARDREIEISRRTLTYFERLASVANSITVTTKSRSGRGEWVDFEYRNCDRTVSIQRVYDEKSGHRGLFIPDKGIKPEHSGTIEAEGWDAIARGLLDHMAVDEWNHRREYAARLRAVADEAEATRG